MQEFFKDTADSKMVKSILRNTELPIFPTVEKGDYVIEDCIYIYKNKIIKCTSTGKLENNFSVYQEYKPWEKYEGITTRFISKYNYYDTETHEMFGEYLRAYRGLTGINLMPFYNCYSGRYKPNFSFYKTTENLPKSLYSYKEEPNKRYKVIAVPIKFDKDYTVSIDSNAEVVLKSFFCDDDFLLKSKQLDGSYFNESTRMDECVVKISADKFSVDHESIDDEGNLVINNKYPIVLPFTSFKKPFIYRISLDTNIISNATKVELKSKEKKLFLLIQVLSSNNSSITVLEGRYDKQPVEYVYNMEDKKNHEKLVELLIQNNEKKRYNFLNSNLSNVSETGSKISVVSEALDGISPSKRDEYMLTDLSLLKINNRVSYAFSDRMTEYLLDNVIDSEDTISENVIVTNNSLGIQTYEISPIEWSTRTRYCLFNRYRNMQNVPKFDINGYGDKDIEKYIIMSNKEVID